MSEPVLKLEVALATDPTATTQLWTDLTAWWLADTDWRATMGRTSERERFPAGTAQLRLDNADRRFDPTNTSSPYAALTVTTTLSAAVTSTTATTISVASSASLPTDQFEVTVGSETMLVTAGFGTATLTVRRGYKGTTAATHSSGATVTWTTSGLLPDRRVRVTAHWNLLTATTAKPTYPPTNVGTWVAKSNVAFVDTVVGGGWVLWARNDTVSPSIITTGPNAVADEGMTYTAIASLADGDGPKVMSVGLEFFDSSGGSLGVTYGATVTAPIYPASLPATVTATAPAGTTHAAVLLNRTAGAGGHGLAKEIGLFPTDIVPAWSAGGGYNLFAGGVGGWSPTFEHPGHSYVDLDVVDAIEPLNLTRLNQSPYEIELRKQSNLSALWTLADETGATRATAAVGGRNAVYDRPRVAGEALIAADPRTGMSRTYTDEGGATGEAFGFLRAPVDAVPATSTWTISWVAQASVPHPSGFIGFLRVGSSVVGVATRGQVTVWFGDLTGTATEPRLWVDHWDDATVVGNFNVAVIDPEEPHHYALTASGTQLKVYIDGVLRGTITMTSTLTLRPGVFEFGLRDGWYLTPNLGTATSTFAALAVFDGAALSQTIIAAHSAAAFTPWTGDKTGARINRILDAARWPTADRSIAVGDTTLGPVESFVGSSALGEIQAAEEAEGPGAAFYISPAGIPTFRNRRAIYTDTVSTAPVATFSDSPGAGEYAMGDAVQPILDNEFVVTESRVKRTAPDAGEQVWTSPARSRHYTRSIQRTLNLQTDAEALARAQWDVGTYGTAQVRVDRVTLHPAVDQALWPVLLGLVVGNRIRVVTTPLGSGSQVTIDGLIEGREIVRAANGDWSITYRLNTRETTGLWRWGISRWGVDTRWAL